VGSVEASEGFERTIIWILGGVGLCALLLGWLIARFVSNRILVPISQLTKSVRSISLGKGDFCHNYHASDEIGELVKTLDSQLEQIADFTLREREFKSHASHELRTPATVIKGAVEILKQRVDRGDDKLLQPLGRIERALEDIRTLIDSFLLLARQEQDPGAEEMCGLPMVVKEVADAHGYLLEGKPVQVRVRTEEGGSVRCPMSMVTIALGNLVRNAFQYTTTGEVEIISLPDRVRVHDTGPGFDAVETRSGLGLTIVRRICERMGWRLEVSSTPEKGTQAELIFSLPPGKEDQPQKG